MRRTIDLLKANNAIKIITQPLDVNLEIPHLAYLEAKRADSKALLFTNPIDKNLNVAYEIPVLMNLFASFKHVKLLVGDVESQSAEIAGLLKLKPPKNLKEAIALAPKMWNLKNLSPKIIKENALCQEVILRGDEIDLESLPILKTWEGDGGKFITMGQCYTQNLDGSVRNLGMYRLQVHSKNRLGLHFQVHKDSMEIVESYKKAGQKMPVSIAIGGEALYTWCATAPLPYGIFELMLYGFLRGRKARLVKCVTNELCVPYDSDIVIEGFVDIDKLQDEGRFGDHTGFYT
ncbi:MAG: UbiD family decarboxylase, partial [Helicobacter sp.]|nr:UbiD family decarboxylase [Helicobacter sp.]